MKADALELIASPAPAFGENLFGETIPDIVADPFEEQLPRSTFAPPPVDKPVLDYDETLAEIDRLHARIDELKFDLTRLPVKPAVPPPTECPPAGVRPI